MRSGDKGGMGWRRGFGNGEVGQRIGEVGVERR